MLIPASWSGRDSGLKVGNRLTVVSRHGPSRAIRFPLTVGVQRGIHLHVGDHKRQTITEWKRSGHISTPRNRLLIVPLRGRQLCRLGHGHFESDLVGHVLSRGVEYIQWANILDAGSGQYVVEFRCHGANLTLIYAW